MNHDALAHLHLAAKVQCLSNKPSVLWRVGCPHLVTQQWAVRPLPCTCLVQAGLRAPSCRHTARWACRTSKQGGQR